MNYDYDTEPYLPSDSMSASITAEVLRCIAHSLLATARQLDPARGYERPQAPKTTQSDFDDDEFNF